MTVTKEIVERTFHQFLSPHNVTRLGQFTQCEQGWDGPKAKPMQEKSMLGMLKYLQQMREKGHQWREGDDFPKEHQCSTFMSADGCVELNWYNENWVLVNLSFINDTEVEVFLSRPDIDEDTEYTTKIDADNVPYYTFKADTVLRTQEQAMQAP